MSQIQFDEEYTAPISNIRTNTPKGILGILIKKGFAKDTAQANVILIITILICVVIMMGLKITLQDKAPTGLELSKEALLNAGSSRDLQMY